MCRVCRDKDLYVASASNFDSAVLAESGNSRITLISESGLYRILAKCNLPKCEPFESWVTHVVLPILFYSPLLLMATIKSHRMRCGGISQRKKHLLEQNVSCSVYISVMHTTTVLARPNFFPANRADLTTTPTSL